SEQGSMSRHRDSFLVAGPHTRGPGTPDCTRARGTGQGPGPVGERGLRRDGARDRSRSARYNRAQGAGRGARAHRAAARPPGRHMQPPDDLAQLHLAAIVESSQDAIISLTLDGVILSWNGGAERLFGYTAAEALGRSASILVPENRMDEQPAILARIRR